MNLSNLCTTLKLLKSTENLTVDTGLLTVDYHLLATNHIISWCIQIATVQVIQLLLPLQLHNETC